MDNLWHRNIDQGTDEWHYLRLGKITASKFKDVMAKGAGKTRKAYMMQLAAEVVTGQRVASFTNTAMEWGTETEPQAKSMFEFENGCDVEEVTFIELLDLNVGISPDGIIEGHRGIEIQCPNTTTQIETYLSGKMPATHKHQVQGSMWVTGFDTWEFVSFDPRINGKAGYFHQTIERDDKYIDELKEQCQVFNDELQNMIKLIS